MNPSPMTTERLAQITAENAEFFRLAKEHNWRLDPAMAGVYAGELLAELARRPTPEQVAEQKEQAVKEAVADVLRQMRWPLLDTPEDARVETVYINRGRNMEIRNTNQCADAQAHRYHVDLGPWPETSTEF